MAAELQQLIDGHLAQKLAGYAAKADLAGYAAKTDLAGYAAKTDLAGYAAKDEHRQMQRQLDALDFLFRGA